MAKTLAIALVTEKVSEMIDTLPHIVLALQEGGFIIHEILERQKSKEGKCVQWVKVERAQTVWCNVCQEYTITERLRCEKCGARRG